MRHDKLQSRHHAVPEAAHYNGTHGIGNPWTWQTDIRWSKQQCCYVIICNYHDCFWSLVEIIEIISISMPVVAALSSWSACCAKVIAFPLSVPVTTSIEVKLGHDHVIEGGLRLQVLSRCGPQTRSAGRSGDLLDNDRMRKLPAHAGQRSVFAGPGPVCCRCFWPSAGNWPRGSGQPPPRCVV